MLEWDDLIRCEQGAVWRVCEPRRPANRIHLKQYPEIEVKKMIAIQAWSAVGRAHIVIGITRLLPVVERRLV